MLDNCMLCSIIVFDWIRFDQVRPDFAQTRWKAGI